MINNSIYLPQFYVPFGASLRLSQYCCQYPLAQVHVLHMGIWHNLDGIFFSTTVIAVTFLCSNGTCNKHSLFYVLELRLNKLEVTIHMLQVKPVAFLANQPTLASVDCRRAVPPPGWFGDCSKEA